MKNSQRVSELLAELRELAEYDFEQRHLDALEQDLNPPPVVEIIDETHQKFLGRIYHKKAEKYYVSANKNLHRVVWEYFYGKIPAGYSIHHIDCNKDNNDISNLQILTNSEHRKLHNSMSTSKEYTCEVCGKKFYSANIRERARFCSNKCMHANYAPSKESFELRQCKFCGKKFRALKSQSQKFCSRSCSAKNSAQAVKKYPLEKTCPICGKKFLVTAENSLKVYCSRECGHKSSGLKATKYPREKTCPVCSKIFSPVNHRSVCCSISCAAKLREQKKK